LNGGYLEAYLNRGNLLYELARPEQAAASLGKGLELCGYSPEATAVEWPVGLPPTMKYLPGLRRHLLMQLCDWRGVDVGLRWIGAGVRRQLPVAEPFTMLGMLDDLALQRAAAEIWTRAETPPDHSLGPIAVRQRAPKIRLGYFSSDFRAHPVAYLTAGLFE